MKELFECGLVSLCECNVEFVAAGAKAGAPAQVTHELDLVERPRLC
jgi:hypothetical protein